ncbi:MAG: hypothetical protein LJE65_14965 [Desulfobacteraceae bacterium]|nr:hypothetical protein [Desulfobacteraceae bacterium]
MPKKKKVDSGKLIQMVKDGVAQKKIMGTFKFTNSTQLKVAYANALMETGAAPEIAKPSAAKSKKAVKKEVKVSKRGTISVPKDMIAKMGFKEGDSFTVKKTKAGISLSKK